MAASLLLTLGSIVDKKGGVLAAMQHNKRTKINGEHIDVARTPLNYCLTDPATPEAISLHAKVQMLKAGIEKSRKNCVLAVEILFSLPIERHAVDTRPFFNDCFHWTRKNFACELLSFDVHLDESAPHAHAVLLPILKGKMQGDKVKGDRPNVLRLNDSFYAEVASRYGLSKPDSKRLSSKDKHSVERQVLTRLKGDSVMLSCVWACVRDAINKDPMPFAQMLSIEPEKTLLKVKSFVDHKRSKGKGSFVA
jgi:Plasmid recombination enzyme